MFELVSFTSDTQAHPRNLLAFFTALSLRGLLRLIFEQILSLLHRRRDVVLVGLLFHGVPGVEDDGVGDDGDGGRRVPVDRDREEDVAVNEGESVTTFWVRNFGQLNLSPEYGRQDQLEGRGEGLHDRVEVLQNTRV